MSHLLHEMEGRKILLKLCNLRRSGNDYIYFDLHGEEERVDLRLIGSGFLSWNYDKLKALF